MKKNVKYLGAAAAALLAVAPIATTGVANAASIQVNGTTTKPASVGGNIVATLSATNVASLKAGANPDSITADLSASLKGETVQPKLFTPKAYAVPAEWYNTNKDSLTLESVETEAKTVDGLKADTQYVLVAQVGFMNLNTKGTYTVNDNPVKVDAYGNVPAQWLVSQAFQISKGNAYFTQGNATFVNGQTVNPVKLGDNTTVDKLADAIMADVKAANTNTNVGQVDKENLKTQIRNSLAQAGVTVNADGSFAKPVANFNVQYTAHFSNGSTATVTVPVEVGTTTPAGSYTAEGPQFAVNANGTSAGIAAVAGKEDQYTMSVKPNSTFNAESLLKDFDVTVSKTDTNTLSNAKVVSSNVNTAVPGDYTVVLSATNPAGVTNKINIKVTVGVDGVTYKTVNYVKGYKVVLWNINGNRATVSSNKVDAGSTVGITGSPITVNGVQYYKVAGTNDYIQAQYVNGEWKPANGNSHESDKNETAIKGVVKVVYNGRGGVKLLNGKGEYQDQVVKNGSSWKVFAKKTVNGRTLYRLGNDNQWIPAQYVNFR